MIARIQLQRGRSIHRKSGKNRHVALAFGALLAPASLMAYAMGFWRLASDMGLAGQFAIDGLFSHWQIWIALAVFLQASAWGLNRYGRGDQVRMPRVLMIRMGGFRSSPPVESEQAAPKLSAR